MNSEPRMLDWDRTMAVEHASSDCPSTEGGRFVRVLSDNSCSSSSILPNGFFGLCNPFPFTNAVGGALGRCREVLGSVAGGVTSSPTVGGSGLWRWWGGPSSGVRESFEFKAVGETGGAPDWGGFGPIAQPPPGVQAPPFKDVDSKAESRWKGKIWDTRELGGDLLKYQNREYDISVPGRVIMVGIS